MRYISLETFHKGVDETKSHCTFVKDQAVPVKAVQHTTALSKVRRDCAVRGQNYMIS
jgi:hypothetical protein